MRSLGVIGECMLEFRQKGDDFALGFGGDALNTGIYASRTGLDVRFFSATGDDHFSDHLLNAWTEAGIDTDAVRILPGRSPGLYVIQNDASGERYFHYWRDASPFRQWLEPGDYVDDLPEWLQNCDCVYFSSITLALLNDEDKEQLFDLLETYRHNGGKIAFDSNYRPRLWQSSTDAASWIDRAYASTDIAMPSFDDEALLRDDTSLSSLMDHIAGLGPAEIVIKRGPDGVVIRTGSSDNLEIRAEKVENVVDTTSAGDSFNGSYLSKRLAGGSVTEAAKSGCATAAKVIQHHGAIIPTDA